MHIKELEMNAGLPLFERIGRKLYVTEAGQELLVRAREILRALKDAEDSLTVCAACAAAASILRS